MNNESTLAQAAVLHFGRTLPSAKGIFKCADVPPPGPFILIGAEYGLSVRMFESFLDNSDEQQGCCGREVGRV